jgi:hypothetical protein
MKRILSYITGKKFGNRGTKNRMGGKEKKATHPSDILGFSKRRTPVPVAARSKA